MTSLYIFALVGAALFFLLSPGVIVTIPGVKGCSMWLNISNNKAGCATSLQAVALHTFVYVILFSAFIFYAKTKLRLS